MICVYKPNIFNLCAFFDYTTFKLKILDDNYGISVSKLIAIAIYYKKSGMLAFFSTMITI